MASIQPAFSAGEQNLSDTGEMQGNNLHVFLISLLSQLLKQHVSAERDRHHLPKLGGHLQHNA